MVPPAPLHICISWEPFYRGRGPRNLAENSEAASFLDQTTSFETEVQEREPWVFTNGLPAMKVSVLETV
jgi:hypothetical protein